MSDNWQVFSLQTNVLPEFDCVRSYFYHRRAAKVMFSYLMIFKSACLCVFCLSVSNITGKRVGGFSWNFHDMLGKIKGTIWKILMRLTPWIQGHFFYFLDLCLVPTLWDNRWMDIHEICRIKTQDGIGQTVPCGTKLFRPLKVGAAEVCGLGMLLVCIWDPFLITTTRGWLLVLTLHCYLGYMAKPLFHCWSEWYVN